MKILVCTDGSEHSQKAIETASKIAGGGTVHEVGLIHIYEPSKYGPYWVEGNENLTEHLNQKVREMEVQEKEKSRRILSEAAALFEKEHITVKTFLKEGRAADNILRVIADDGYDMVVLGCRGLSGLKKMFLGSVSNAVLMEAKANVLIVK
jgi:nucleotide-binding universal stress UspA family protein